VKLEGDFKTKITNVACKTCETTARNRPCKLQTILCWNLECIHEL